GKPLPVTNYWQQLSGPGTIAIANTNARVTSATFPTPGTYGLRFYATDGEVRVHTDAQYTYLSAPRITSVEQAGNVITITWISAPGRNYRMNYKSSLTDPTWTTLGGGIFATSNLTSLVITNTVSPRFYRVSGQ
ncbi:MAG TPA: hypothetical protein VK850_06725, partial [Candidatus Binatia bacterium]|nr:hypothetical protein [Candidatus Binatia bacterium]